MEFPWLRFYGAGRKVITVLLQLQAGRMPRKGLLQLRTRLCSLSFQCQIVDQPKRCGFVMVPGELSWPRSAARWVGAVRLSSCAGALGSTAFDAPTEQ